MQQGSPDSYNVDLDLMALYKNISVNVNLQRKVKGPQTCTERGTVSDMPHTPTGDLSDVQGQGCST